MRSDEAFVIIGGSFPLRCGRAIYFRRPEKLAQVKENRFYKLSVRWEIMMSEIESSIDRSIAAYWLSIASKGEGVRTPP